jgi:hypothetical protein
MRLPFVATFSHRIQPVMLYRMPLTLFIVSLTAFLCAKHGVIEGKYDAVGRAGEVAPPSATPRQQPFEILSRRRHDPLAIHLHQPTQPEPSQAVPLLALSKQWLHPHFAFLIGLFVRLGLVIRSHPIQILLIKAAAEGAPGLAGRTFWL